MAEIIETMIDVIDGGYDGIGFTSPADPTRMCETMVRALKDAGYVIVKQEDVNGCDCLEVAQREHANLKELRNLYRKDNPKLAKEWASKAAAVGTVVRAIRRSLRSCKS